MRLRLFRHSAYGLIFLIGVLFGWTLSNLVRSNCKVGLDVEAQKQSMREVSAIEATHLSHQTNPTQWNESVSDAPVTNNEGVGFQSRDGSLADRPQSNRGNRRTSLVFSTEKYDRKVELLRYVRKETEFATSEQCDSLKEYLTTVHYKCNNVQRFGHTGDGGWSLCMDNPLPKNCTISC